MKKKRKKKRKNRDRVPVTSPHESGSYKRYDRMLQHGREQLQEYYNQTESLDLGRLALDLDSIMETEPQISLNKIAERYGMTLGELYAGMTTSKDRTIVSYYSRPDIRQAIFSFARDRKIAVVRNFRPLFQRLRKPEDILPLMVNISESYTEGRQWPSMHGTISRYDSEGRMRGCDLVAEIDFKRSWSRAFDIARPLVKFFRELGICFLIKFSGHTSPHIIIPAEAIPEGLHGFSAYRAFFGLVRKRIKESSYLDSSFSRPSHFLRLPYSIHELTGKVSLPIRPEDYDSFSPKMARIDSVEVLEDWWPIPSDARERNQTLVDYVSGGQKQIVVGAIESPRRVVHTTLWEQMVEAFEKGSRVAQGTITQVADDDSYYQMVQAGQENLEYTDALLKDETLCAALEKLINSEHTPSIKKTAREHGVDPEKLWFLWRWSLRQNAFDHYSQPDVQQAVSSYVENRKIWLAAGSELYVDLRESSHILPLMAYVHSNQSRNSWPGLQRTKGIYNPQTHALVGADMVIDFSFRNGSCDRAIKIMTPLLDMLQDSQVTFSVSFSGNSSLHVAIPSEAIPQRIAGKKVAFRHHSLTENLSTALRKIIKLPKDAYSWAIVPYGHTCVPYSVDEHTGAVCMPLDIEDPKSPSPEMARFPLAKGWKQFSAPPDDAPQMTEAFLRKMLV